ncbi:trypsin-like peptidase domain-containing protein [Candidatus Woesearchaeota archaeon]|nr:trypsin-like peptidase domain-containing protein [Candidatus Woesearchaeota archaeon]
MKIDKNARNLIIVIALALVLAGSLTYYFSYRINAVKQDYEAKISDLSMRTSENLKVLKSAIAGLGINLSSQIGLVDTDLKNFKSQNQQEIKTLSGLIDEIERQSNLQLSELKDELKNIRIKSADFSAIVDDVLQSVVSIKTNVGQGSGAIIDKKGYIVTNVHVISGASTVKAATFSGDTYNVNVLVGYDTDADIAVLKIDAPGLKAMGFGDSDDVKVGEKAIAAGNPAGLAFTVTEGIVSAFRTFNGIDYIQTDVPINPGNSGGPLINTKGEIIGINNFKAGGFEGLGFAISSNDARSVVDRVIADYEAKQKQ